MPVKIDEVIACSEISYVLIFETWDPEYVLENSSKYNLQKKWGQQTARQGQEICSKNVEIC